MEIPGIFPRNSDHRPPMGGTFGELLKWHLAWGTRPNGTPDKKGVRWKSEEFASAINFDVRTINNWKNGGRPTNFDVIEREFFGNNAAYEQWRLVLRGAYENLPVYQRPSQVVDQLFAGVPARPLNFFGRADDMESIGEALDPHAAPALRRAVIHGLGGIGKSSLASEYAHIHRRAYGGVWWSPAETRDNILRSLVELAAVIAPAVRAETDLALVARQALSALSQSDPPWLLIYDNVPNPISISDLLPPANTSLLITSRFSDWRGHAQSISLKELSSNDSVRVLCEITENDDRAGAARLAEALGNLPLALNHAGFTCRRTGRSFTHYSALVEAYLDVAPSGVDYAPSVFATFKQALKDAASINSSAEALMYFLGQCASAPTPSYLTDDITGHAADDLRARLLLEEFSLLRHEKTKEGLPTILVHRLVQAVAREEARAQGLSERYLAKLKAALIRNYPSGTDPTPSRRQEVDHIIPHVLVLNKRLPPDVDHSKELTELFLEAGSDLKDLSLVGEAENLLRRCIADCRQRNDNGVLEIQGIRELGNVLQIAGRNTESIRLYEAARRLSESESRDDEELENCLSLGNAHRMQGDLEKAEIEYTAALRLANKHKAIGGVVDRILQEFAYLRLKQDRHPEAKALLNLAIDRIEKGTAPLDFNSAGVFLDYGAVLRREGKFDEARSMLERSLSIYEKTKGVRHPVTAQAKAELGLVLFKLKDVKGGQAQCEEAISILEEKYWPEHGSLEVPITRLADILHSKGELSEAESLYQRALTIGVAEKGKKSKDHVYTLAQLSNVKESQKDFASAKAYLEAADRIFDHASEKDLVRLSILSSLASVQNECLEFESSEKNYRFVIRNCPQDDPLLIRTKWNLAIMLERVGKKSEARNEYLGAMRIIERREGHKSVETIAAFARLAEWMSDEGWIKDAIVEYEKCIADLSSISCAGLMCAADIHASFGRSLARSGNWADARTQLRHSLRIIGNWPAFDGRKHIAVLNDLAVVETHLNNNADASALLGKCVNVTGNVHGYASTEMHLSQATWALSLCSSGKINRAVELGEEAYKVLIEKNLDEKATDYAAAVLAAIFEIAGRPDEAREIRRSHCLYEDKRPTLRPSWGEKSSAPLGSNRSALPSC